MEQTHRLHGKKILYKKEYMDSIGAQGANPYITNELEKNQVILTQQKSYEEKYDKNSFYRRKRNNNSGSKKINTM